MKDKLKLLIPQEHIENKILLIRGQKVMLDRDLVKLYGVSTKRLNEQVRRNIRRFPPDFLLYLNKEEAKSLRSQFATLKRGQHSKYRPYAFTELGVAMFSSVLNSERAIEVNIQIMRAFVKLRHVLATHADILRKIQEHDHQIKYIFEYLKKQLPSPDKPKRKIGFTQ